MSSDARQPEDNRVLGLVLAQFLFSRDWQVAGEILERFPCLLSQAARGLVGDLVIEAQQRGNERDVLILRQHLEVLERANRLGIEAAIDYTSLVQQTHLPGDTISFGEGQAFGEERNQHAG